MTTVNWVYTNYNFERREGHPLSNGAQSLEFPKIYRPRHIWDLAEHIKKENGFSLVLIVSYYQFEIQREKSEPTPESEDNVVQFTASKVA